MQKGINDIIVFLIAVSALILLLVAFIIAMLYLYKRRQVFFIQNLEQIKLDHEKQLLSAQLEMQEQTFKHISREIHDNISLSLTLAKLHLNTLDRNNSNELNWKICSSIELLSQSIYDLSDISKSLNADIIIQQGLIKAIENEMEKIRQAGNLKIRFELTGIPIYLESQKELIIFRIIQEAFNNIIKHSHAKEVVLNLHFTSTSLNISLCDNGTGFNIKDPKVWRKNAAGLKNMEARIKMIKGTMHLNSHPGLGTSISFFIPLSQ
jgi:two-component system NarL family sensor kinase